MSFWVAPDTRNRTGDLLLHEQILNVILRVRVNGHGRAIGFQSPDASQEVRQIGDRAVADRPYYRFRAVAEATRHQKAKLDRLPIGKMDR